MSERFESDHDNKVNDVTLALTGMVEGYRLEQAIDEDFATMIETLIEENKTLITRLEYIRDAETYVDRAKTALSGLRNYIAEDAPQEVKDAFTEVKVGLLGVSEIVSERWMHDREYFS